MLLSFSSGYIFALLRLGLEKVWSYAPYKWQVSYPISPEQLNTASLKLTFPGAQLSHDLHFVKLSLLNILLYLELELVHAGEDQVLQAGSWLGQQMVQQPQALVRHQDKSGQHGQVGRHILSSLCIIHSVKICAILKNLLVVYRCAPLGRPKDHRQPSLRQTHLTSKTKLRQKRP